jgi:hypothetical protein
LSSIALNPTTVQGGASSTGTVTLSGAAPTAGAVIVLSSKSNYAVVPASVTIAAGAKTGTFMINTSSPSAVTTSAITATYAGASKSATLTINPGDSISSVTVTPKGVGPGGSATGTVTLASAAPTGGWLVKLTSSVPSTIKVPASVTIPARATSINFSVTTGVSLEETVGTITASDANSTASVTFTVY